MRVLSSSFSWLVAVLAALTLPSCAKKTAEPTSPPESGGAMLDDIASLERELAAREQQLARFGAAPAGAGGAASESVDAVSAAKTAGADMTEAQAAPTSAPAERTPMQDAPQDRCTTVCELSASICQLEDRICALAPRHPDEPRYQAACERAARDCEFSREACHACT